MPVTGAPTAPVSALARPVIADDVAGQLGHVGRDLVHAGGDGVGPGQLLVGAVDDGLGLLQERVGALPVTGHQPGGRGEQPGDAQQHVAGHADQQRRRTRRRSGRQAVRRSSALAPSSWWPTVLWPTLSSPVGRGGGIRSGGGIGPAGLGLGAGGVLGRARAGPGLRRGPEARPRHRYLRGPGSRGCARSARRPWPRRRAGWAGSTRGRRWRPGAYCWRTTPAGSSCG